MRLSVGTIPKQGLHPFSVCLSFVYLALCMPCDAASLPRPVAMIRYSNSPSTRLTCSAPDLSVIWDCCLLRKKKHLHCRQLRLTLLATTITPFQKAVKWFLIMSPLAIQMQIECDWCSYLFILHCDAYVSSPQHDRFLSLIHNEENWFLKLEKLKWLIIHYSRFPVTNHHFAQKKMGKVKRCKPTWKCKKYIVLADTRLAQGFSQHHLKENGCKTFCGLNTKMLMLALFLTIPTEKVLWEVTATTYTEILQLPD